MLPAAHRLIDPQSFRAASRQGRRAGSRTVVAHLLSPGQQVVGAPTAVDQPARAGFVVSRAVGGSVVRNRVKRRLRHAVRARIDSLPVGSVLVVRAQPAAATASYDDLVGDLDRCLAKAAGPAEARR